MIHGACYGIRKASERKSGEGLASFITCRAVGVDIDTDSVINDTRPSPLALRNTHGAGTGTRGGLGTGLAAGSIRGSHPLVRYKVGGERLAGQTHVSLAGETNV